DEVQQMQLDHPTPLPKKCTKENGIIKRINGDTKKVYIPEASAEKIRKDLHVQLGHLGRAQLNYHFTALYYTPNLEKKIDTIVATCEVCLHAKENRRPRGRMGSFGHAQECLEIVHLDTVGGFAGYNSPKRYMHMA